jgi:hypothetical protein
LHHGEIHKEPGPRVETGARFEAGLRWRHCEGDPLATSGTVGAEASAQQSAEDEVGRGEQEVVGDATSATAVPPGVLIHLSLAAVATSAGGTRSEPGMDCRAKGGRVGLSLTRPLHINRTPRDFAERRTRSGPPIPSREASTTIRY